ncbi:MAG: glutamate racemase [Candidatus Promineofilum sp.]|nr:glutamate racemase [Promineifilum sp.]
MSDADLLPSIPKALPDLSVAIQPTRRGPLGVLDSGVGGLSVLVHLCRRLPAESMLYFADQAHIPYGPRSPEQLREFTAEITSFLLRGGAKTIVVACNTATAAALDYLRQQFPTIPFVGMEPAVKPAAQTTRSGKVGVLATPSTLNSHRYAGLMSRYAAGIQVYEDPCNGLVQLIEAGAIDAPETRVLLHHVVDPMLAAGVDTLVLGCTHYPFVRRLLAEVAGPDVAIIDPAPAVARHTQFVLQQHQLAVAPDGPQGSRRCFTSGSPQQLEAMAALMLDGDCPAEHVHWRNNRLLGAP